MLEQQHVATKYNNVGFEFGFYMRKVFSQKRSQIKSVVKSKHCLSRKSNSGPHANIGIRNHQTNRNLNRLKLNTFSIWTTEVRFFLCDVVINQKYNFITRPKKQNLMLVQTPKSHELYVKFCLRTRNCSFKTTRLLTQYLLHFQLCELELCKGTY